MKWFRLSLMVIGALVVAVIIGWFARHELTRLQDGLPSFTHGAGDELEIMVPMVDGVQLYTTVQLPDGDGPFPTVVVRSPYAQFSNVMRDTLCGRFARYGYACVFQDTRGQGESEGDWEPGANEIGDGRDTLAWLVEQDFQDGNIGMVGPSYLASVQFAALAEGTPPELKTIIPSVYTTDTRGVMYQDGLFRHETFTAWASMMRGSNSDADTAGEDYQRAVRHRPHNEVDTKIYGAAMPWYQEMIAAASPADAFWQREDNTMMREIPQNMSIPILMIGGWYDVFFGPQFEDWERLATQSNSRFIIGPWTHAGTAGELPTPNSGGGLFQWSEMLPWLEHHLKGEPLTSATGLNLYVMGDGDWQQRDTWPTTEQVQTFYLANLDAANDCDSGRLAGAPGMGEATYTYDPDNPVPTRGGAGMLAFILPGFDGAPPANVDQAGLCDRDDVLTFQGEPLADSILISGDISVTLDVSSSAPDTAFTARLIEVFPDGRAMNIRDSITSLAFRNGAEFPQNYTPGERASVTIDFWPIKWRLQPGSRLRVDISSSDFPKFHAHTNRAGPWAEQVGADIANQVIYGGSLTLPP